MSFISRKLISSSSFINLNFWCRNSENSEEEESEIDRLAIRCSASICCSIDNTKILLQRLMDNFQIFLLSALLSFKAKGCYLPAKVNDINCKPRTTSNKVFRIEYQQTQKCFA